MSVTKNIIDTLKNQGIKVDSAQLSLLEALSKIKINKNLTDAIRRFTRDENLGIYIWGDVGRGKTLIVNEFLKQLKGFRVKSFHYIDFMSFVHDELNRSSGKKNPLKNVSKHIANKCNLIFIDEFQVEDVADAMIVTNILERILNFGLKIIITSNAHPDDLYQDGLQRQKFIKSMQICTRKLGIFNLNGDTDYRTKNIIDLDNNKKNIYSDKDITKLIDDNFISHLKYWLMNANLNVNLLQQTSYGLILWSFLKMQQAQKITKNYQVNSIGFLLVILMYVMMIQSIL